MRHSNKIRATSRETELCARHSGHSGYKSPSSFHCPRIRSQESDINQFYELRPLIYTANQS